MPTFASSLAIAVVGMAGLTVMGHGPTEQSRKLALIVPPWQGDGLALAAATGLAIVDLRWEGHVVILDTGGDPTVLKQLRGQGLWLLDATGARACGATEERT